MTLTAVDPSTGRTLEQYPETTPGEVVGLVEAAAAAFTAGALEDPAKRVAALRGAAAALRGAEGLPELVRAESGLPEKRVAGELERTCVQLELFADVVERGEHLEAIIDPADPAAKPAPRPDLRRMLVPLGPVVVFGASNFPLAFGVAGGDTAAALAAGCPVIAKGHPSQPGTNALVADCVAGAIRDAGLPEGTFASVQGASAELGEALVDAEGVTAVSFTGSTAGGRALFDRAARRPVPIPVYAEMGSTNPAVLTGAALAARGEDIAAQLVASISFAAGQLCTKPGVVLLPDGSDGDAFIEALMAGLNDAGTLVMLNARLLEGFGRSVSELGDREGVDVLSSDAGPDGDGSSHPPVVATARARSVAQDATLREEVFGPAVILARYADDAELEEALIAFEGQLATAIFAEPEADAELLTRVTPILAARCGRVSFDAFPTGVAVTWAMQHGGPYPATTTPDHTSVGLSSTRRFMRPVCWQSAPAAVLPEPLRDANPAGIWRRVDGALSRDAVS